MIRSNSTHPLSSARAAPAADTSSFDTPYGKVEVYSRDPAFVVAAAGRYVVQIIHDHATSTTVSLMSRVLTDLSARYEKFGYVALIEPHAQLLLPPDIKNGFNALIKRHSPRFTGAAIVFERTGFQATAVRSVVTAINFASRATHENHVFSDLRDGVTWLAKLTPPEPTAAGLLHIIQQLRVAHRAG